MANIGLVSPYAPLNGSRLFQVFYEIVRSGLLLDYVGG